MSHVDGVVLLAAICLLLAGGCQRGQPQPDQRMARGANEDAALRAKTGFDDAVGKQNWPLAKAQADVLLAQYPGTAAARQVQPRLAGIRAKADAARDAARTAALWSYNREPVAGPGKAGGTQLSASIYAGDKVDADGSGAKPVRLVFRDHPSWGRSAYLVLEAGDFNCHGGCKLKVRIDDGAERTMAASRPQTDEAIAMFIKDHHALWAMTRGARRMAIQFPVSGGSRTAVFEVAGLDRTQLPNWD